MGPDIQFVMWSNGRCIKKCDCYIKHICHYNSAMRGQSEYKNNGNQLMTMKFIIKYEFL